MDFLKEVLWPSLLGSILGFFIFNPALDWTDFIVFLSIFFVAIILNYLIIKFEYYLKDRKKK